MKFHKDFNGTDSLQFGSPHKEISDTYYNGLFRWFKFTLKPPYSIAHDKL